MDNRIVIRAFCIFKGSIISILRQSKRIHQMGINPEVAKKEYDKRISGILSSCDENAIMKDMIEMAKKYHFGYDEYFIYHFYYKTIEERLKFVPDMLQRNIVRLFNKAWNQPFFDDKGCCAKKFNSYYKRDVCAIYKSPDLVNKLLSGKEKCQEDFRHFIKKHQRFIVKPIASGCGEGVKIIDQAQYPNTTVLVQELANYYCLNIRGGFIVEELIMQDERMAAFHRHSVNTVRITTIKYNDNVDIIHPFVRFGRGGSVVDNGGQGGIMAAIDPNNGTLLASADEEGVFYTKHPDSGIKLIGFTIPRWDEAIAIAKKLAFVVRGNRYAAWDLALTPNGWVMVEGNAMGQFVGWQISTQVGFKEELNDILAKLHMKPLD